MEFDDVAGSSVANVWDFPPPYISTHNRSRHAALWNGTPVLFAGGRHDAGAPFLERGTPGSFGGTGAGDGISLQTQAAIATPIPAGVGSLSGRLEHGLVWTGSRPAIADLDSARKRCRQRNVVFQ